MPDSQPADRPRGSTGPVEFHSESIRKNGVVLLGVTLLSSGLSWILYDGLVERWAIGIVACFLLYLSLRLLLARKNFRTWFDGGRVYWEFPSRLQGIDDSCLIAEITRLHCTRIGGTSTESGLRIYHLIQKDGSKKIIGWQCMGDVGLFLARLREENPGIEYGEADG